MVSTHLFRWWLRSTPGAKSIGMWRRQNVKCKVNKLPVISWDISWSVTRWVTCFYRLIWLSEARTHISIIWVSAQFANQAEPTLMKCPHKTSGRLNEGGKWTGLPHSCNHLFKTVKSVFIQSYRRRYSGHSDLPCAPAALRLLWGLESGAALLMSVQTQGRHTLPHEYL